MKLSQGEIFELNYLAGGGSSIHPLHVDRLYELGLITRPKSYVGSGHSISSDYPTTQLTTKGWQTILLHHKEANNK